MNLFAFFNGFCLLCGIFLAGAVAGARPPESRAVYVVDGDTLDVAGIRVRLYGIDAPEAKQSCLAGKSNAEAYACGQESRRHLTAMIKDRPLIFDIKGKDSYGRVIALVYVLEADRVSKISVNEKMVRDGEAVAYTRYTKRFVKAELAAKTQKAGLWRGQFTLPQIYRRKNPSKPS